MLSISLIFLDTQMNIKFFIINSFICLHCLNAEWIEEEINSVKIKVSFFVLGVSGGTTAFQEIIKQSVELFNNRLLNESYYIPVKIVKVDSNGNEYEVKIKFGETTCLANESSLINSSKCLLKSEGLIKEVIFMIFLNNEERIGNYVIDESNEILKLKPDPIKLFQINDSDNEWIKQDKSSPILKVGR